MTMHSILPVIVGLAMFATVGVLLTGLVSMARGGTPQQSNKLMRWRVIMQAAALVLFALMMSLIRS